jgi:hypothetical protein
MTIIQKSSMFVDGVTFHPLVGYKNGHLPSQEVGIENLPKMIPNYKPPFGTCEKTSNFFCLQTT